METGLGLVWCAKRLPREWCEKIRFSAAGITETLSSSQPALGVMPEQSIFELSPQSSHGRGLFCAFPRCLILSKGICRHAPFIALIPYLFFFPQESCSSSQENPTWNGHSSQRLIWFHNGDSCTLYPWLLRETGWLPIIYEDKETLSHIYQCPVASQL